MRNHPGGASRKNESAKSESKQYELGFAYSFNWDNENDIKEALRVLLCNNDTSNKKKPTQTFSKLQAKKDNAALEAARIRWLLAINPNTPPPVLDHLTRDSPPSMLERIAEHPRSHSTTLSRLANHEDSQVRAAVAENMNTPIKTLWRLLRDPSPDVRLRMAEGYNIPFSMLRVLAEDENPYVSVRAQKTMQRLFEEVRLMRGA